MRLSGKIIAELDAETISVPKPEILELPERVLQFGTGVLLRGLPDHFIDKANKQHIFNGRIVVVKSTTQGDTADFVRQDGLYTLIEKGIVNGQPVERISVNASISRVLSAVEEWDAVLACAANPTMQVVISNTTEIGILLHEADAKNEIPVSFPGRVLAFLEERYRVFNGSTDAGMVIIPTELIVDNGTRLKQIVLTLAGLKKLPEAFLQWLDTANEFCNSLVDCIVPGKLPAAEQKITETQLGYEDALLIMSEPYRLWAIETKKKRTASILSFSPADPGVVLTADIHKFRELKLRLLNATHTLSCGLAHLAGFVTVKEAMADKDFATFLSALLYREIVPLVVSEHITMEEANRFASQVIDRFSNPYIEHAWLSISMQYTSKMQMRVVPLFEKYYRQNTQAPELMSLGLAAYILFMHATQQADGSWTGSANGKTYRIQDDKAGLLSAHWQRADTEEFVDACLSDLNIFGTNLSQLPGLTETVKQNMVLIKEQAVNKRLPFIFAKRSLL